MPVLAELRKNSSYAISILAGEFGRPVLEEEGFDFQPIETNISLERAGEIFEQKRPDLLFSATSWKSNVEQQFRNAAYEQHIKSVVVFDYWSNPALRWKGAVYPLPEMRDIVCVMDEVYRDVMREQGFPKGALVVTGQPHLERLCSQRIAHNSLKGLPRKFLFLSQPLDIIQPLTKGHPLGVVIQSVSQYAQKLQDTCLLTIKLHPKDDEQEIEKIIQEGKVDKNLKVNISPRLSSMSETVKAYEVVLGYRSMGLFEVKALGCPTLALDLVVIEEPLRLALKNFGIPIVAPKDIQNLEKVFSSWKDLDSFKNQHQGAIQKIVTVIKNQLSEEDYVETFAHRE